MRSTQGLETKAGPGMIENKNLKFDKRCHPAGMPENTKAFVAEKLAARKVRLLNEE